MKINVCQYIYISVMYVSAVMGWFWLVRWYFFFCDDRIWSIAGFMCHIVGPQLYLL